MWHTFVILVQVEFHLHYISRVRRKTVVTAIFDKNDFFAFLGVLLMFTHPEKIL